MKNITSNFVDLNLPFIVYLRAEHIFILPILLKF